MASSIVEKLNKVLADEFKDFRTGLSRGAKSDRVTGYIVSSDFGMSSHEKRQVKLERVLKKHFTPAELIKIGPIVTMNPTEADLQDDAA